MGMQRGREDSWPKHAETVCREDNETCTLYKCETGSRTIHFPISLKPSAADFRSMSKPGFINRASVKESDKMIAYSGQTYQSSFDRADWLGKEQGDWNHRQDVDSLDYLIHLTKL